MVEDTIEFKKYEGEWVVKVDLGCLCISWSKVKVSKWERKTIDEINWGIKEF